MSRAKRRIAAWFALGAATTALAGFGGWIASLPKGEMAHPVPIPATEQTAILEALASNGRKRPVIAVIGLNDATETTDYLMPTGILRRADVADVVLVAAREGPLKLYPALTVMPDAPIDAFDAAHPDGADYVIVPAMSRDDDPVILAWLQSQADKGAIIIGVCAGAKVVAAAGLLQDRRATTHWYYLPELLRRHPSITAVPDRRYVIDHNVATTTGVSASMPMALTLIEAIAGRPKANQVAAEIGLSHWDASHDSSAFGITRPFAMTVLGNLLSFWRREQLELELPAEFDAVSLALTADAWSRTYRSRAFTRATSGAPVADRDGIRVVPDRVATEASSYTVTSPGLTPPAHALDQALRAIRTRYGPRTASVVAMQLEYASDTTAWGASAGGDGRRTLSVPRRALPSTSTMAAGRCPSRAERPYCEKDALSRL